MAKKSENPPVVDIETSSQVVKVAKAKVSSQVRHGLDLLCSDGIHHLAGYSTLVVPRDILNTQTIDDLSIKGFITIELAE